MRVLHLAAHLGGGIGRAHAALVEDMPRDVSQTFFLLQEPVDRRFADLVARRARVVVGDRRRAARLAREADVVQVEWWGHPALDECLAHVDLAPDARVVVWCHVSCLHEPVPPPWLVERADRFVFTSPVSMPIALRKFAIINSGFGFRHLRPVGQHGRGIVYLGTVDFKKMHPGVFDALDMVDLDFQVPFWGRTSVEATARAAAMRRPERARLMGYTEAPRDVLLRASVLLYPLRPDHYGTGESALVEAMSLGIVPVVLRNPAECAIVEDGVSGVVVDTVKEAVGAARVLMINEPRRVALARGAVAAAARRTPAKSAAALVEVWKKLADEGQSPVMRLLRQRA